MAEWVSRLRELRRARGWSQQQVADLLGLNKMSISLYESGKRTPSFEVLDNIAETFNVSYDYLLCKASINTGYPGREHSRFMLDPDAARRMNAYGVALIKAYNAASEDTQAAVNAILHLESIFDNLDDEEARTARKRREDLKRGDR